MTPTRPLTVMSAIEKRANEPLQVLATQKKVSFDETNMKETTPQAIAGNGNVGPNVEIVALTQQPTTSIPGESVIPNDSRNESFVEGDAGVVKPMEHDILSGRGAGINLHPGNIFFRSIIKQNKQRYLEGDPGGKKRIIRHIVEATVKRGRFLKQDPKTELWQPITMEEAKKKTGQALRENAPEIKKQRNELKHKLQLAHQLRTILPKYVSPIRNEAESSSLGSQSPPEMTSSYAPPMMSTNATNLLWSRMNMLQEKQEQLKRKQRELEDEQNQLTQYFYQMTAALTNPAPLTPVNFLFSASSDSGSDSETDQMYTSGRKKRRIIAH